MRHFTLASGFASCGRLRDLLRLAAVAFLFVSIFAGKFSFDRFFAEESRIEWLQIRLWFTPLAAGAWLLAERFALGLRTPAPNWRAKLVATAVLIYCGLLVLNAAFLGNPVDARTHLVDLSFIVLDVLLLLLIVRTREDLTYFFLVAEAVGVCLFLFSLLGFRNPDINGPSFTPFGGPITYYRIQFLAFCAALYLWMTAGTSRSGKPHLVAAFATLFAVFSSLSKAALFAAIGTVALLVLWLFILRRYREGLIVAVFTIVTFCTFSVTMSEIWVRFSRVAPTPPATAAQLEHSAEVALLREIYDHKSVSITDLSLEQVQRFQALWELTKEQAPDYQSHLKEFLEFAEPLILIRDGSSRIRMVQRAWSMYKDEPWTGVGIGNYRFQSINYWKQEIEEYRYPHNLLFEHLAVAGRIGLLLLVLGITVVTVVIGQTVRDDHYMICLAAYLVFIFVTALFAGDYYDFRLFWFAALLALVDHGTATD